MKRSESLDAMIWVFDKYFSIWSMVIPNLNSCQIQMQDLYFHLREIISTFLFRPDLAAAAAAIENR